MDVQLKEICLDKDETHLFPFPCTGNRLLPIASLPRATSSINLAFCYCIYLIGPRIYKALFKTTNKLLKMII